LQGKEKVFGPRTAKDLYRKCVFYTFLGSGLSTNAATVSGNVLNNSIELFYKKSTLTD